MPASKIAAWVSEPPDFTYESGMFHIRQKLSENCVVERVMSPNVFFMALRRAAECAKQHHFMRAEVIDFPGATDDEIAASSH